MKNEILIINNNTECIEGECIDDTFSTNNQNTCKNSSDILLANSNLKWRNGEGKQFLRGNSIKEQSSSKLLYELAKDGICAWIESDKICLRNRDGDIERMESGKIIMKLSAMLHRKISFGSDEQSEIKYWDLLSVDIVIFNPHINAEFYEKNGIIYRNIFQPTKYMCLDKTFCLPNETPAINALLMNLFKKRDRVEYALNWLSYFFQNLNKPPVAILLKGSQGAGKGILYEEILVPLFGERQCFQINDKSIRGTYIGSMIENKLVINFDEISSSLHDNNTLKNVIKMLISNPKGSFEKKYLNTERETPLYSISLFSSNSIAPVQLEHKDRRFSVFSTGENISNCDYLNYGSINNLLGAIKDELEDFALMLLNYPVDIKKATTAMDTPEKEALVGITTDRFENFLKPIKEKNLNYFIDLKGDPLFAHLYNALKEAFQNNKISRKMLREVFSAIECETISTKKLMTKLNAMDSTMFSKENSVGRGDGNVLYKLDPALSVKESIFQDEEHVQSNHHGMPIPPLH